VPSASLAAAPTPSDWVAHYQATTEEVSITKGLQLLEPMLGVALQVTIVVTIAVRRLGQMLPGMSFVVLLALWISAPQLVLAQSNGSPPPWAAVGQPKEARPPPPGIGKISRGAPGPVVAVGLPFLMIAGGAYWLWRRRRRTKGPFNSPPAI
jgi:hypothetical protein